MGCLGSCCCCCGSEEPSEGPKIEMNRSERKMTDVFMLLLYIGSWGGLLYIMSYSVAQGADPDRLIHGYDLNNNICGISPGYKELPVGIWPWISTDVLLDSNSKYSQLITLRTCFTSCDDTETSSALPINYKSFEIFHFCYPDPNDPNLAAVSTQVLDAIASSDSAQQFTNMIADIAISWPIFLWALLIATCLSLFFIILCRFLTKWIVWSSVLFVVGGSLALAYFLNTFASIQKDDSNTQKGVVLTMRFLSYFIFLVGEVFLVVIALNKSRIQIAIEIVEETSKAAYDMMWMFSIPAIIFVLGGFYFYLWVFIAINIFSVQQTGSTYQIPDSLQSSLGQTEYTEYDWDHGMRGAFAFHFFHLLWTLQFILYSGYFVLVGALADWYFTPMTGDKKIPPQDALIKSFRRFTLYNMGTIAYASLLLAIVRFAEFLMLYLENKMLDKTNPLQTIIIGFVLCILRIFETAIDQINKLALIVCAIQGTPLCKSGKQGTKMTVKYLDKIAFLAVVGHFVMILGKYSVALGTTAIAAWILTDATQFNGMSSIVLSCAIVFLISYMISKCFMMIFETCIDAISVCFMIDLDQNKGGHMFASPGLAKIVDKYAMQSKETANSSYKYRRLHEKEQAQVELQSGDQEAQN